MKGRIRGPSIPVIFEQEGSGGNLRVGFTEAAMQEVDQAERDRLWNADVKDFEPQSRY